MTAAAPLLRIVLESAKFRGVDGDALMTELGLTTAALLEREGRFPTRTYLELFARAETRARDASFGSTVAARLDAAAFGLVGFVVQSAPTLREALERLARYSRLLCDELHITLERRDDVVAVVYDMRETPYVPALFEMAFVHFVATARKGTRGAFAPSSIVFRHPGTARTLADEVGADVAFGGDENAILVEERELDRPLRGANAALLEILEAHSVAVLSQRRPEPEPEDPRARGRAAIAALLPKGEPTLQAVAARLGVGERTLQRRLREAGTTFRRELDEVRRDAAIAYLARPNVSICEVAYSLGFAEPSAFHHAFRRWTGRSPRQQST